MNKATVVTLSLAVIVILSLPRICQADDRGNSVHRRSNFSNEFKINTPEGINARGSAKVYSKNSKHHVRIHVNGLLPDETYVILNHWFEPVPERGVPESEGALVDPSCNGHFQFLGEPVQANKKGKLNIHVKVNQLAPHIWVANLAKFQEVTQQGTQAPATADAFTTGGLLIPYADIVEREADFIDTEPLTECDM